MNAPTAIRLFTYQVGFGDCFLLRFEYGKAARHVLVDLGSTAAPARQKAIDLLGVAEDIRKRCGKRLDAIVATHRHRDHISGFAGAPWKVLATLKPRLVVLPWTEDPDAATNAKVAPSGSTGRIGALSSAHARSLDEMQAVAESALRELGRRERSGGVAPDEPGDDELGVSPPAGDDGEDRPRPMVPFGKELTRQLRFVGEDNLKNAEAVGNLLSIPARDFVCYGSRTRLEQLLPGVTVRVLGPPTLVQSEAIRTMRRDDPAEYWQVMAGAAARSARADGKLFPRARAIDTSRLPLETRWFLKRVDTVRGEELLQIVRALDGVMNNTSVILLIEACGKKLLFPGDAQIEDWSFALSRPDVLKALRDVDVYKVGHHGSRNATPKTVWNAFAKKGTKRRLLTFMSTRASLHGQGQSDTEVPRKTLVAAMEAESTLFSTQGLTAGKGIVEETQLAP